MTRLPSWRQWLDYVGWPPRMVPHAERREIENSGLSDATWYGKHAPAASSFRASHEICRPTIRLHSREADASRRFGDRVAPLHHNRAATS